MSPLGLWQEAIAYSAPFEPRAQPQKRSSVPPAGARPPLGVLGADAELGASGPTEGACCLAHGDLPANRVESSWKELAETSNHHEEHGPGLEEQVTG